jgi:hypothetical protein
MNALAPGSLLVLRQPSALVTAATAVMVASTTVLVWLVVRAIVRESGPCVRAKPQVGLVAAAALVALVLVGPRWPLRSWWTAGGVVAAVALAAPYVVWQQAHGWPQLTVAGNIAGSAEAAGSGSCRSSW